MNDNVLAEAGLRYERGNGGAGTAAEHTGPAAGTQPDAPPPDEPPHLAALETALRQARAELARLQAYARGGGAAPQVLPAKQRVQTWLREGLELVRTYPAQGLLTAAMCGFILGKLLRR